MDISRTPHTGHRHDNHFRRKVNLTSRDCYDFYRANRRSCPKGINQFLLFEKAVEGLFMVMQDMLVQSESGVYITGLGYFANTKVKSKSKKGKSLLLRAKTRYTHLPYFFPDEPFKDWTMNGTAKTIIKSKLRGSGIKYKLRFDLIKSLSEAQLFAQKVHFDRKRHGYR